MYQVAIDDHRVTETIDDKTHRQRQPLPLDLFPTINQIERRLFYDNNT
jgi:hypothetical protein